MNDIPKNPTGPVMLRGIPVSGMRVMRSSYDNYCYHTGKKISVGEIILYKSPNNLNDNERNQLFPNGNVKSVVALYDAVMSGKNGLDKTPFGVEGFQSPKVLGPPKEPASEYQEHILYMFWRTKDHLMIQAFAGCGKTNTLQRLAWSLQDHTLNDATTGIDFNLMGGRRAIYLAYSKRLKIDAMPKLHGTSVAPSTTHSFMLNMLGVGTDAIVDASILDRDRFLSVICAQNGVEFNEVNVAKIKNDSPLWGLKDHVIDLVYYAKNWAVCPKWEDGSWVFSEEDRITIKGFIKKYKILVEKDDIDTVVEMACDTISTGLPAPGCKPNRVTFEDMLYVPIALDMPMPQYDLVLADEIQDFNRCQILIMKRLAEAGARFIGVGDKRQCIYRFRSATSDGMAELSQELQSSRPVYDCILPINYRSSRAIIRNAQRHVPEIRGFKDVEGEIKTVDTESMMDWVCDNPEAELAILARTNDPLFKGALSMMRHFMLKKVENRKVCILGRRGVGAPLINMIEQLCEKNKERPGTTNISDTKNSSGKVINKGLVTRIKDYLAECNEKWGHDEDYRETLARIQSNAECIQIVCDTVEDDRVSSVIGFIKSLVTDKPDKNTVVFSTVHGAKGLEWDNVFVIEPGLFPHPKAVMFDPTTGELTEEGEEEQNIIYVRDTRAKINQYMVIPSLQIPRPIISENNRQVPEKIRKEEPVVKTEVVAAQKVKADVARPKNRVKKWVDTRRPF